MAQEPWLDRLEQGEAEAAWDLLIDRYHRLIAATIRHSVTGYDDVMDVFAFACEALRADDLARIRSYMAIPSGRVRFSTWLVAAVRNLVADWFRHRDGRKRLRKCVADLPELEREAVQRVYVDGHSLTAAYELILARIDHELSYGEFLRTLSTGSQRIERGRSGALLPLLNAGAFRSRWTQQPIGVRVAGPSKEEPPDHVAIRHETRRWLEDALAMLSAEDRLAVQLYIVHGLPAASVARAMGWKERKTVYNRVYRALATLRRFLREKGIEPSDLI